MNSLLTPPPKQWFMVSPGTQRALVTEHRLMFSIPPAQTGKSGSFWIIQEGDWSLTWPPLTPKESISNCQTILFQTQFFTTTYKKWCRVFNGTGAKLSVGHQCLWPQKKTKQKTGSVKKFLSQQNKVRGEDWDPRDGGRVPDCLHLLSHLQESQTQEQQEKREDDQLPVVQ